MLITGSLTTGLDTSLRFPHSKAIKNICGNNYHTWMMLLELTDLVIKVGDGRPIYIYIYVCIYIYIYIYVCIYIYIYIYIIYILYIDM